MELRAARPGDAARIGEISEASFQASYALSPEQIETVVGALFSPERLRERVDDPEALLVVAEDEGTVVGFVDVELGEAAAVQWLHVHPDSRGRGVGTALFERALAEAGDRDLQAVARVLAENEEGTGFPEQFGLRRSGKAKLEVGSEVLFEEVYAEDGVVETAAGEAAVEVPETATVDGETHRVDADDETPGTDGPFFGLYADAGGTADAGGADEADDAEREGYLCGNCGSTDVGSDSLGRLECQNCGNKHLADQWDAAYL